VARTTAGQLDEVEIENNGEIYLLVFETLTCRFSE
jgi:hypothetical protein